MESRKKTLRYVIGIDEHKSTHEVKIPKWKGERIESNGVKCYFNSLKVLTKIKPSSRILLDVILMEMDRNNYIKNDALFKKNCQVHLKKCGADTLANSTINNGFKDLLKHSLLVRGKSYGRSLYRVNPLYYCRVSDSERIRMLRAMREAPFKDENNMLRHELLRKKDK